MIGMIGFLVRGRVRIKIKIRIRVGVMFNVSISHRSNCHWSKCHTFKMTEAVFFIFLKLETRSNTVTHYQNAYGNAFRKAFLELLRLSSNSIASTRREEGLVTAQLLCAVWLMEQRSCRARAFT